MKFDNCGMNYHPGTKYFLKISLDCCLVSCCTLTLQTANKLVVCSVFLVCALKEGFHILGSSALYIALLK